MVPLPAWQLSLRRTTTHRRPASASGHVERSERQGHVWEELLVVCLVTSRSSWLPLPKDGCQLLPRRWLCTKLGRHDEGGETRRHAKAQNALDINAHRLQVNPGNNGIG